MMLYTHTKEYSYIVGVYLGDGYIYRRKRGNCLSYVFTLRVIDKDFVENVRKLIKKITKKEYAISFIKPNVWRVSAYDKSLSQQLLQETNKKNIIPEWIKESDDKDILKWFIAGFLDSDGYASLSKPLFRWKNTKKGRRQLTMGFISIYDWIDDIVKILDKLGVKTGKKQYLKKQKPEYKQIMRYTINYSSFVEAKCFFKLKRKVELLKKYGRLLLRTR